MLKPILLGLLMSISLTVLGQDVTTDSARYYIPPANQKMLEFTEAHMGQQIGGGICAEFVTAAVNHATGVNTWRNTRRVDTRVEWIKPGDVLYMSWKRGRRSHVAVIIEVKEPHIVKVAHQNFNRMKYVVETTYDLNQKIREGRKVKIYRPKAPKEQNASNQ